MKKNHHETVHDENLFLAKLLGAFALAVVAFYTVRGLFMGGSFLDGIKQSWLSGWGIVILLLVLMVALVFFLDWLRYVCMKKIIIRKGTMHTGRIVSEVEVKKKSRRDWKYVIELDDRSLYKSTAYTKQTSAVKCTAYVLGSRCVLTDFRYN